MCGILGVVGVEDARLVLHEGLERLEYRGYDSAGIAVANGAKVLTKRVVGRVAALDTNDLPPANFGIAHTRWATHGAPTEANAHPHLSCDGKLALAHNGIIENYQELRAELTARGHDFQSETDTEVIVHLLEELFDGDLTTSLQRVTERLEGSYAVLAMHVDAPHTVAAVRRSSPLVIGLTEDASYIASDVVAFRAYTDQAIFLEDGDVATLSPRGVDVVTESGETREVTTIPWKLEESTLAGFPHFMIKEIHDQPRTLGQALLGRTTPGRLPLEGALSLEQLASKDELLFLACGSSFNAALAAKPLFEHYAGVRVHVELASEYEPRRRSEGRTLVVAVTQSGETADTLSALRAARQYGFDTLAVCNVVGSTATRTAHGWLPIHAGPEVSVAATKSFTSQLLVLHMLALQLGHVRGATPASELQAAFQALQDVPTTVRATLDRTAVAEGVGRWVADHDHAFVLGRGTCYAGALETALKIKEVSYVHAEGFAAGELKHGPLALIEEGTPVLAFAAAGKQFLAMVSNMREVAARGGRVVVVTDAPDKVEDAGFEALAIPGATEETFVYPAMVVGQVIAYHAAVARGADVDRPRNLAKSVTVE